MSCFYTIISLGPVGLWALTNIVQVCNSYIIFSNFIILSTSIIFSTSIISSTSTCQAASFHEVMHLGHLTTGVPGLSTWSWLLLLTANLYWVDPLLLPLPHSTILPICFTLYLMLITYFVMSIRHTSQCLPRYSVQSPHWVHYVLARYCLLAWAHMAVLFLTTQAGMINLTLRSASCSPYS